MIRSSAGGSHSPVPRALRVDDGNRTALADAKAVGLAAENAALVGEAKLVEPALQKVPRRHAAFHVAALGLRLLGAEEDMPAGDRNADSGRDIYE